MNFSLSEELPKKYSYLQKKYLYVLELKLKVTKKNITLSSTFFYRIQQRDISGCPRFWRGGDLWEGGFHGTASREPWSLWGY